MSARGEILTERQSSILKQLGYSQSTSPGLIILGVGLLVGILMMLVRGFMMHFTPKVYRDEKQVILLMLTAATLFCMIYFWR